MIYILASVSYDAYCSMMDYARESQLFNPYNDNDSIVKWIAIYYVADMDKRNRQKGCSKKLHEKRITARYSNGVKAEDFASVQADYYDDDVQHWDITFEQLQEAYKTTAMKRNIPWTSKKTYEKIYCIPFFKVRREVGDFPRRITWLYVDTGKNNYFRDLQIKNYVYCVYNSYYMFSSKII